MVRYKILEGTTERSRSGDGEVSMQRSRRVLSTLVLLALVSGAAVSCAEPVQEEVVIRPVKAIVLGDPGAAGVRSFPGSVRAEQRAKLSFRVSGPLVRLPVFEGQQVRKGQLLAQIDPRDFETEVRNTEARLADLNAQYRAMQSARPEDIRRLEAGLAAAQSKLLEATASFRRYQRLYENDNISKAEYDQARAARDVAEAEVQSAQESLEIGRTGARPEDMEAMEARIRAMKSDLNRAQDRLKDTELRAPYDGIVAERYIDNFEFVSAFNDILNLQNINIVEIVAQIPENIVASARRGNLRATFKATFPSLPGVKLDATPTEFATQADPVTRTYSVTFQTSQPETASVYAGMTAEIEVTGSAVGVAGWLVPVSAVFADSSGSNVWILDEDATQPRKVSVELGEPSGDSIWILSGVETGQTVITAGAHFITEVQQVRLVTDELRDRQ